MAEFCVECWNKLHETNYPKFHFVQSDDGYICEGCGEVKRVVIREKGLGSFLRDWL